MNENTFRHWTYAQISLLWELARDNTPTQEIGRKVGKTYEEVCRKALELGISLPRATAGQPESNPAPGPLALG